MGSDSPVRVEAPDPPIFLFFETPVSLDAFWTRLKTPDFVILRGDRYQSLLNPTGPSLVKPPLESTTSRVAIRGSAGTTTAELSVIYDVNLRDPGPQWVPLKLDGLALTTVKEAGQTLRVRSVASMGWEVEVAGKGQHVIEVKLVTSILSNGEERRLELSIPLAPTTTLGLVLSEESIEALLGTNDPIVPLKVPGISGTRLDASMTPRSKLDLSWRVPVDQSKAMPPLLSAQGEIAIDVSPDAIRSRVRCTVTAVRGTTRELAFSLDSDEDLLDLELDNRSLAIDTVLQGRIKTFTISLSEPLRQGSTARTIALTTRRRVPPHQTSTVSLNGYPLRNATLQTGALSVTQSGSIWVEGVIGRGLTRIDPANGLPSDLRSRPGTILGYRFVEQPFDLKLKIEPSPPLLEARARSTLTLLASVASSETEFQFRATPGQIFSVRFRIPRHVILEPTVPDDTVQASNLEAEATIERTHSDPLPSRILNLRLTSRARETGVFAINLRTRQPWTGGPTTSVALCEPLNATSLGGRIAVRRVLGIVIDFESDSIGLNQDRVFRLADAPAMTEWSWPTDSVTGLEVDPLWLTYEGLPDSLPLSLKTRPRSIRSESDLSARVTRTGIDYREIVHLDVFNGLISELDLNVPAALDRAWEIEGSEIASRELRETGMNGDRRYRLILSKGPARILNLRLRYRTTFPAPLEPSAARIDHFAKIRIVPEVEGVVHFSYDQDPGVTVAVDSAQKEQHLMPSLSQGETDPVADRLVLTLSESTLLPNFKASAESLLDLPQLVVSRSYLRTLVGADELRTTAQFLLDRHGPDLVVVLPTDARWIEAKINGQILPNVERVDGDSRYRITLPLFSVKAPTLLTMDYSITNRSRQSWTSPQIEDALCQVAYWEIVVPSQTALLGVPTGWSDENIWYWDKFLWMRKPALPSSEIRKWITGSARLSGTESDDAPTLTTAHSYLFCRTDGLFPIPVKLASRVLLLGLCSGAAGLIGIVLVLLRPSYRFMTIPFGMFLLVVAVGWDPNVTFQVLQSGSLGLFLAILAAALQRIVDRRGLRTRRMNEPTGSITTTPQVFTTLATPVGSDDSTAIRGRRQSTADRILIAPASPSELNRAREIPPLDSGIRT